MFNDPIWPWGQDDLNGPLKVPNVSKQWVLLHTWHYMFTFILLAKTPTFTSYKHIRCSAGGKFHLTWPQLWRTQLEYLPLRRNFLDAAARDLQQNWIVFFSSRVLQLSVVVHCAAASHATKMTLWLRAWLYNPRISGFVLTPVGFKPLSFCCSVLMCYDFVMSPISFCCFSLLQMASQPSIASFFKRKSSENEPLKKISPNKKVYRVSGNWLHTVHTLVSRPWSHQTGCGGPKPHPRASQRVSWSRDPPDCLTPAAMSGHGSLSERHFSRASPMSRIVKKCASATRHRAVGMVQAGMKVGSVARRQGVYARTLHLWPARDRSGVYR